ncbi:hypothetical protein [Plantibacter sp. LMC-P-059a]|uniref:ApeA N-terminal domain 1-containing protein n=1 Tax=Plantibacter sp. LMC-P-059a TaxID=3040297 RepID=UPI002549CE61|nr:hypothetical protein [Plantibacter sp. LMC-P-059a]
MAIESLQFGDSIAGQLIDGDPDTPLTAATMRMLDPSGIQLDVPFMSRAASEQFVHLDQWFSGQDPPQNMVLLTAQGSASLFNVQWAGHTDPSGHQLSLGRLRARETVLGHRDGVLDAPLVIETARSRIDGLNAWARSSAISRKYDTDERGRTRKLTLELDGKTLATWSQGQAEMSITSSWTTSAAEDGYESSFTVGDNVHIESRFAGEPRPFFDHFVEQRKIASLLVFLFACPISFREHRVQDESFPARMMDGRVYDHPFVELISELSVRERSRPVPSAKAMNRPTAYLEQIGPEGLEAWNANYDAWSRFILPAAGVLGRSGAFMEDVVTSTSMSIEAAGHLLGVQEGEESTWSRNRPSTATYVYRCLHALGIDWGSCAVSIEGLARAVANNYNAVKHFDRGDLPAHEETYLISIVTRLVVQLTALQLTGKGDQLLVDYRSGSAMWDVRQRFAAYGLRVESAGAWARTN